LLRLLPHKPARKPPLPDPLLHKYVEEREKSKLPQKLGCTPTPMKAKNRLENQP
jgi:hypothetical protein